MSTQIQKQQHRRKIEEKLPNSGGCVYNRTPNKTFDNTGGKLLQKNIRNTMDTIVNLTVFSLKPDPSVKSFPHIYTVGSESLMPFI
jgi:hypothetical protein